MQFNKKGQAWTIDFVILSLIIMIILFTFIYFWNFMAVRWDNVSDYDRLYLVGLYAAESLVNSHGVPPNWEELTIVNTSTLSNFGLIHERNIIITRKLDRLYNISLENYSFFKDRLGATNYELFINVTNLNRTQSFYQIGNSSLEFNVTVAFERFILYNDSISILRLEVWE